MVHGGFHRATFSLASLVETTQTYKLPTFVLLEKQDKHFISPEGVGISQLIPSICTQKLKFRNSQLVNFNWNESNL